MFVADREGVLPAATEDGVLLKAELGLLLTDELQVLVPEVSWQVFQHPFMSHQFKSLYSAFRVPLLNRPVTTLSIVG